MELTPIGKRFDCQIDSLSEQQLTDYFTELVASYSWSAVRRDLYGLKVYDAHVLRKPWMALGLIRPPRAERLPDIVAVHETQPIFAAIRATGWSIANLPVPAGRLLSILAAISIAVSFGSKISSLARTIR